MNLVNATGVEPKRRNDFCGLPYPPYFVCYNMILTNPTIYCLDYVILNTPIITVHIAKSSMGTTQLMRHRRFGVYKFSQCHRDLEPIFSGDDVLFLLSQGRERLVKECCCCDVGDIFAC